MLSETRRHSVNAPAVNATPPIHIPIPVTIPSTPKTLDAGPAEYRGA